MLGQRGGLLAIGGAREQAGHGRDQRAALVVTVYTYCVASISVLAPQFRIFMAFTSLCLLPLVARVLTIEPATSWQLAAVLLLGYLMNASMARVYRRTFHGTLALKLRTEQLAEQLADRALLPKRGHRILPLRDRSRSIRRGRRAHRLGRPARCPPLPRTRAESSS